MRFSCLTGSMPLLGQDQDQRPRKEQAERQGAVERCGTCGVTSLRDTGWVDLVIPRRGSICLRKLHRTGVHGMRA